MNLHIPHLQEDLSTEVAEDSFSGSDRLVLQVYGDLSM